MYYHCTDNHGECDNTYIREERLGALLGDVIKPIGISPQIAEAIATALHTGDADDARARKDALQATDQRRRSVFAKQDRAYEDLLEGRISQDFWNRKSEMWEAEIQTIEAERARLSVSRSPIAVTAEKVLELAKQAENLYESQDPAEQRRLLETVLSNCTFDAGTLCPTYAKPLDLLVEGNKTRNWLLRLDSNQQPSG